MKKKSAQGTSTKPVEFSVENLDIWTLEYCRAHPIITALFLVFLSFVSLSPFIAEFYMDERLLTQADVYDTNRVLFWLHLFTDLAIGLAYMFITGVLIYLTVKAGRALPFLWAFVAFGVFIVACGMTHFMEAFVLWQPVYWMAGGIKWLTAVVSVGTAVTIPFLVPKALQLIEIGKIAHIRKEQLEVANRQLIQQKHELEEKTKDLELATAELKTQTETLEKTNAFLTGREQKMIDLKQRIAELEDKKP